MPRLRMLAVATATLASAFAGTVLMTAPASPAVPGCEPTELLENPCRPWYGASSNAYSQVSGAQNQYYYFEQRAGRDMDMVHTYHAVGQGTANRLTDVDIHFINRPDTILYTNWALTADFGSADGSNASVNSQIDQMANSINSNVPAGKKIFMTLHHEPENDLSSVPAGCNFAPVGTMGSAEEYVDMWENVRERFSNIPGADDKVVWVMNYMNYPKFDCMIDELWPGNDLVDWISFNGYHSTNNNVSYEYEVGRFYNLLTARSGESGNDYLSKPWGIVEWGIHSSTQQNAYLYYQQAKAATEANRFPKLGFYMVFDNGDQNRNIYDFQVAYGSNRTYDPVEQAWWNIYANSWSLTGNGEPPTGGPSTPSGVQVSAASGQPVVTWNTSTDDGTVDSYDVWRISATGSPGGVPAKIGTTSDLTYTDASAPNGTNVYQVVATDNDGNKSQLSNPASVGTSGGGGNDTTAPTVPTGVTATLSGGVPLISWNASSDNVGVTSYQVRRGTTVVGTVTSGTQFSDTAAPQGRTSSYTVRARDAAGNSSAYSASRSVFVPDTTAPTGPSTFTATRTSGTRATLGWGAASDNVAVTGYWVYRGTTRIAQLGASARSYTATGLSTGQTYTFRVRPRDAAGNLGTGLTATG